MGDLIKWSYIFYESSLELRSATDGMKWRIDMPRLNSLLFGCSAFENCSRVMLESEGLKREWCLDLPELTSIQLGHSAFQFKEDDKSSELIMRSVSTQMNWRIDMPKLTSLTTCGTYSRSLRNPHSIALEGLIYHLSSQADMPSLTDVALRKRYAFKRTKAVHTKSSSSSSLSRLDIPPALQGCI